MHAFSIYLFIRVLLLVVRVEQYSFEQPGKIFWNAIIIL